MTEVVGSEKNYSLDLKKAIRKLVREMDRKDYFGRTTISGFEPSTSSGSADSHTVNRAKFR